MNTAVNVIIVNFNAGQALVRCVQSVFDQAPETRVTVIDNASSDSSPQMLREVFPATHHLELIENPHNAGFAVAVNQAAQLIRRRQTQASGQGGFLLILNPDCELRQGALNLLLQALETRPQAALAGPRVIDAIGETQKGTYRHFPDPWKSFLSFSGLWRLGRRMSRFEGVDQSFRIPEHTTQAEAVSGACMLVREEVFSRLGGLDEAYGLHCEDLDLMYRLHQSGFECLVVPEARVFHQQGISSRSRPLWVHWQKHRGMQRFFSKFQAANYNLVVRCLVIAGIWARFLLTTPLALLRR